MKDTGIISPPKTMMEVFEGLPEGTMVQLIENNIVMSPSPLDRHQAALVEIASDLLQFVKKNKLGVVRIAPYDVYLDKKNAFQPDICFIANEHIHLIQENGLHGAPDLVIEILSPGTARYDMYEKKDVYERTGVKELWLVDPATKTATGYFLSGNSYEEFYKKTGSLGSRLLDIIINF